ncbi:MAG: hypothetical protein ACW98Y_07835 [Candidatus Thorarchaeota archaeon]
MPSDETMVKIEQITKILLMFILIFILTFCFLLLMDWLFGEVGWDYIPGVGKGSGDT